MGAVVEIGANGSPATPSPAEQIQSDGGQSSTSDAFCLAGLVPLRALSPLNTASVVVSEAPRPRRSANFSSRPCGSCAV